MFILRAINFNIWDFVINFLIINFWDSNGLRYIIYWNNYRVSFWWLASAKSLFEINYSVFILRAIKPTSETSSSSISPLEPFPKGTSRLDTWTMFSMFTNEPNEWGWHGLINYLSCTENINCRKRCWVFPCHSSATEPELLSAKVPWQIQTIT